MWFRRELLAKSFICSYWSGEELTDVPPSVFGLDESERLFAIGNGKSEGHMLTHHWAPSPDGSVDLRAGARTWIDALSLSYQLEIALGRELFISEKGFEKALNELGPIGGKRGLEVTATKPTKVKLMEELIAEIWPNGVPRGLNAKDRNIKIHSAAKAKDWSKTSDRTIARALKK